MATLEAGSLAPDFSLNDLSGQSHTLSEALHHGPVLLVIWKTSCGSCRTAFPYLERLRQSYPGAGWSLWAIAQDPADGVDAFLAKNGPITLPVLIDAPDFAVSRLYDPVATPTLFYVDPDQRIAFTTMGFSKDALNEISARVAKRLGLAPVVVAPADDGNPPFKPG